MPGFDTIFGDPTALAALLDSTGTMALRATGILLGALVLAGLLRRSSAAARHALWTFTFGALLLLPVLPRVLPQIPIPIPAAFGVPKAPAALPGGEVPQAGAGMPSGAGDAEERAAQGPLQGLGASPRNLTAAETVGPRDAYRPALAGAAHAMPETASPAQGRGAPRLPAWVLLWFLGAASLSGGLGIALWRSARLCRRSVSVHDPAWLTLLRQGMRKVGLRRRVSLRISPHVSTAMAGGYLRPVVLLPEEARRWDPERRELVLLHELLHLKRADPLRQLLARVVLVFYWFHPLAWWAAREAALTQEEACDEAVVALGHRPSTYARHLLELIEPRSASIPVLSGFSRPPLERRFAAILRSRRSQGGWGAASALLVGAAWALVVVAAAPAHGAAAGEEGDESVAVSLPGPSAPDFAASAGSATSAEITAVASVAPLEIAGQPHQEAVSASDPEEACRLNDAGDGFRSMRVQRGERGTMRQVENLRICTWTRGVEAPADLLQAVELMGPDEAVVLAALGDRNAQRLEIIGGSAGPVHRWFVNGVETPFEATARAWRDTMLEVVAGYMEIDEVRGEEARLQGQIARTRGEEARLRGEVARVRGEEARIRGGGSRARGEEARLTGEIARIQGEEARLRGEMARIRGEDARRRGEAARIASRITALETAGRWTEDPETRDRLQAELTDLQEAHRAQEERVADYDLSSRLDEAGRRLEEHQAEAAIQIAALRESLGALDTDARVQAAQAELEAHLEDAEARIAEVEAQMAGLDVEGEVAAITRRIEALDAAGRIREMEERLAPALRRLVAMVEEMG